LTLTHLPDPNRYRFCRR